MRMIDPNSGEALGQVQLYLSVPEAQKLMEELRKLLNDPEANEHFHLFSEDGADELSCSVVTEAKFSGFGYTPEERRAFGRWKPRG